MATRKLEQRYITLKLKDIDAVLLPHQKETLMTLCNIITDYRVKHGRAELTGLFIESNWPEYEPVKELLLDRFDQEMGVLRKALTPRLSLDEALRKVIRDEISLASMDTLLTSENVTFESARDSLFVRPTDRSQISMTAPGWLECQGRKLNQPVEPAEKSADEPNLPEINIYSLSWVGGCPKCPVNTHGIVSTMSDSPHHLFDNDKVKCAGCGAEGHIEAIDGENVEAVWDCRHDKP